MAEVWRQQLEAVGRQLENESAGLPHLLHVLVQWPDDRKPGLRFPPYDPPGYPVADWVAEGRTVSTSAGGGLFPGWMTQDCLASRHRIEDRRRFFTGADRFVRLAEAAGKTLKGHAIGDLQCGEGEYPATVWLAALHVVLKPDRLFTWEGKVGEFLDVPRSALVQQCSVIEDAVLSSQLAIAALTGEEGHLLLGLPDGPATGERAGTATRRVVKEPSREAIAAYRLRFIQRLTQADVAEVLSKEWGRRVTQPQVSRWCRQAREFLEAGGVLPPFEPPTQRREKTPMDPEKIDLGRRADRGRKRKQEPADE